MKEQLRTEAEKRNLVYAKNINNEYNITGLIDISKNPPKIYCFCTEEIAKEILDFHAQQSKDNTEAIDRLKSIIEACPRGSFFRLELNKVLKDLQIK
mgnify:CR=1 FL=1